MQDWQLVREYVDQGSQAAFAILVERYINLVYSTCLREIRNPSLAEDATQVVFLVLAKKAHTLRENSVLAGWLFQTARFAAKDAMKQEARRQRHELNAAREMAMQGPSKTISWGSLEPHLHEALAGLRQPEREAVLLRFLHDKSLREVATSLGISEEAARKRVARALDKMRRYFSQHGFAVTGVVLATLMAEHAVRAAPASCMSAVLQFSSGGAWGVGSGVAGAGSGASSEAVGVKVVSGVHSTLKAMFIAQVKSAAVACVGVCLVGTGAKGVIHLAMAEAPRPSVPTTAVKTPGLSQPLAKPKRVAAVSWSKPLAHNATQPISSVVPQSTTAPAYLPLTLHDAPAAPRLAQAPTAPAPHQSTPVANVAAETPGAGELLLSGKISKVDAARKTFVLEANSFTLPNGKTSALAPPKLKRILISDQTAFAVRGNPGKTLTLADLGSLSTPVFAIAIGKDLGSGKDLPARTVAVWNKVEGDVYSFGQPVAAPQTHTLTDSIDALTVTNAESNVMTGSVANSGLLTHLFTNGNFENLDGQGQLVHWQLPDPQNAQLVEENDNRFLRLTSHSATAHPTASNRMKIDPQWTALSIRARIRTKNLHLRQNAQADDGARLEYVFENANGVAAPPVPLTAIQADQDWTFFKADINNQQAEYLRVIPAIAGATGTVDFDDIHVVPNPVLDLTLPLREGFPQGNFEKVDANGNPLDWKINDPTKVKIVEEEGNHFLRLLNKTKAFLNAANEYKLDPSWRRIRIQGRMRVQGLKMGANEWENARLQYWFTDGSSNMVGPWQRAMEVKHDTDDWVIMHSEAKVPRSAIRLRISPEVLNASGQVDYDDIKVIREPAWLDLPIEEGFPAGTFENVDEKGNPAGWILDDKEHAQVAEEKGNHFLRLINDTTDDSVSASTEFKLNPAWKKIKIRLRMRGKDLKVGNTDEARPRLAYEFTDDNGKVGPWVGNLPALQQSSDWQTKEIGATVPPDAKYIMFRPEMLYSSGIMDIDDIQFTVVQ